jgi:hypothetical protein
VQLPHVRRSIEARADAVGFAALKRAATALSDAYREGKPTRLKSDDHVAAYLVTRMPATYAAARAALDELPDLPIAGILDIGAGSGAASLAASQRFAGARDVTLIERDPSLAGAAREWLPEARILAADLTSMREFPPHDLVIAATRSAKSRAISPRGFGAARVALVVISPAPAAPCTLPSAASARAQCHGRALSGRDACPR